MQPSEVRPASVPFRDAGVVRPTEVVPIIESLSDPRSILGEEFRLLRARVQEIGQKRPLGCVALVSALPGEGKSTISLGLTTALARDPGKRILLVECDLRRPSIGPALGLPPLPGLAEWLNGEIKEVPVRTVQPARFSLIGAGQSPLERPESMGSPRLDALLRSARERYDFVVVDATPILPVADTVLLQDLVDGMLLVVRSRTTPREAIREALAKIRDDKVVGVVLNDHREYRGSYNAYSYERYGMTYGPTSSSGRGKKRRRSE